MEAGVRSKGGLGRHALCKTEWTLGEELGHYCREEYVRFGKKHPQHSIQRFRISGLRLSMNQLSACGKSTIIEEQTQRGMWYISNKYIGCEDMKRGDRGPERQEYANMLHE